MRDSGREVIVVRGARQNNLKNLDLEIPTGELVVGHLELPALAAIRWENERLVALASDGTFRLHTVFPDGDQNYPIAALAADGEQKRSITLDFQRRTPHAKVNQRDEAVVEWF